MTGALRPVIDEGQPATIHVDRISEPGRWAAEHRDELVPLLHQQGAVMVAGAGVTDASQLAEVRDGLGHPAGGYQEHFSLRRDLGHGVSSMPEWAADREQCPHHDQGYGIDFPRVLLMACLRPTDSGGAVLLADTRTVLSRLPADVVSRFRSDGWLLERNFRPHFGLSWAAAYGVTTADQVEELCRRRLVGWQWEPDGTLHTRQRRSAVLHHPITGEACWFTDVTFFSQWSVDEEERKVLLAAFGPNGIPFNTGFGDGEPLTQEQWRAILDTYEAVMYRVSWRAGDLLLVDNLLTAHGREPYTGSWEVAVAPATQVSLEQCSPTVPATPGR